MSMNPQISNTYLDKILIEKSLSDRVKDFSDKRGGYTGMKLNMYTRAGAIPYTMLPLFFAGSVLSSGKQLKDHHRDQIAKYVKETLQREGKSKEEAKKALDNMTYGQAEAVLHRGTKYFKTEYDKKRKEYMEKQKDPKQKKQVLATKKAADRIGNQGEEFSLRTFGRTKWDEADRKKRSLKKDKEYKELTSDQLRKREKFTQGLVGLGNVGALGSLAL